MNPLFSSAVAAQTGAAVNGGARELHHATAVVREFVFTERQWPGEPVHAAFRRLAAELEARPATLLALMIYGTLDAREEIERAMSAALGGTEWPVTWVDSETSAPMPLAGVQAFAIVGAAVTRVRLGNQVVGSVFEDGNARHCLLGGLGPAAAGLTPAAQTQHTLGNLEWALGTAAFRLSDVVRTWFYNEAIVSWYGDFNRVRSAHYAHVPFRTGSLPASTGIGARNPAGSALVVAAWAMQPLDASASAKEIGSPLQCPAPAYGSSFSRAMELVSGGSRRLFISGTASIWPDGRTAWENDPEKQIALTMEVVAAILQSRGMGYHDINRATAYFKDIGCRKFFAAWCDARELRRMPIVELQAEVCRDDLLFEIEVDAVVAIERAESPAAFDI